MAQGRMIQIKRFLEKKQETYLCERTHSTVCPPRSPFLERWLLALGRKCARGRCARGSQVIPRQGTASLASVSVPDFGSRMIVFATNVVQGSAIVLEHGRTDGGEAGGFLKKVQF